MKTLFFILSLLVLPFACYAQERIDLTTPETKTIAVSWRVQGSSWNFDSGQFSVTFISNTGETRVCSEPDQASSRTLIIALNKANLTNNTFNQRAVNRYSGSNSCLGAGAAAGTPQ